MKELRLALVGYGNAGRAFGRMLWRKMDDIRRNYDTDVKVVAICTKSKGVVVNPEGIDLVQAERELHEGGRFQNTVNMSNFDVIDTVDYDVMVEITTLNIMTGQPAIDHIRRAFARGKHVITANKGPIAWAYAELKALAEKSGSLFFYETVVMDGIPVFNLVRETLKLCKILEIDGILNSTTNFILKEMAEGVSYDEAVEKGKARGFIEADPNMDTDGWDPAAKLTALMNVFMDANLTPLQVDREGIKGITAEALQAAKARGNVIKLLCHGEIKGGKPCASVRPAEIPANDLYATISNTAAVVTFNTDLIGKVSVVEHDYEVEIDQTAYGILSDVVRVLEYWV